MAPLSPFLSFTHKQQQHEFAGTAPGANRKYFKCHHSYLYTQQKGENKVHTYVQYVTSPALLAIISWTLNARLCKHDKLLLMVAIFATVKLNILMYSVIWRFLYILEEHWEADMEIPAECLNSYFITQFCWLAFVLKIDFLSLSLFLGLPFLPSSLRVLEEVELTTGCFRLQRCSKCRVSQTETRGTVQLWTHLQEATEALGWSCFIPSLNTVCLYVNLSTRLSVCFCSLYVVQRLVPFLLFTFSHSQPPPSLYPTVCPCLTHWLSLYIIWPFCSHCACRWDCHGYCDLLWGWQRGWKP